MVFILENTAWQQITLWVYSQTAYLSSMPLMYYPDGTFIVREVILIPIMVIFIQKPQT